MVLITAPQSPALIPALSMQSPAPIPALSMLPAQEIAISPFLNEFIRATRACERRFTPFLERFIRDTRNEKQLSTAPPAQQGHDGVVHADPGASQEMAATLPPEATERNLTPFLSAFIKSTRASERRLTPFLSDFILDTRAGHEQKVALPEALMETASAPSALAPRTGLRQMLQT